MTQSSADRRSVVWTGAALVLIGLMAWGACHVTGDDPEGVLEAEWIASELEALARSQFDYARTLGQRPELLRWSLSQDVDSVARVFEELSASRGAEAVSVDLLDARGDLLAWSGRSWYPQRNDRTGVPEDSVQRVIRAGPFAVLSTTVAMPDGRAYVRVSIPLSSENRIIRSVVPSLWISDVLPETRPQVFVIPIAEAVPGGFSSVEIRGVQREPIADVVFRVEGSARSGAVEGAGTSLALVILGLLVLALRWVERYDRARISVSILLLWLARFAALWSGVSRDPIIGWLGDPAVYASSFGYGLVGTPLDLLLTSGFFLLSVLWIHRSPFRTIAVQAPARSVVASGVALPAGAMLLLVLSRGYAASIRSMVFDSTVQMYDKTSMLPAAESLPLLVSSLMLTISLLVVWKFMLELLSNAAGKLGFESPLYAWGLVLISILLATGAFVVIDGGDVLPPWLPFVGLTAMIPLVVTQRRVGHSAAGIRSLWAVAIVLVALPTIDWHISAGEKEDVRRTVEARMTPGDSWLTFLMRSDLESIAVDQETIRLLSDVEPGNGDGTAFNLWSSSVMSRQPANSGIVMFDEEGKEVDRFVIGFSTYEQDAILRTVFEGAEEHIYVVEGNELGRGMPIYGAWSTVRDAGNRVFGTVATILSPSDEQPLYWAVGTPLSDHRDPYLQAEIVDSVVVWSDIPELRVGAHMDPAILRLLGDPGRPWAWVRHGGSAGEFLYVADGTRTGRVVAAFVPGKDIRWRMFHVAKILLVYGILLLLASFVRYGRERRHGDRPALSFRSKMFTVFAIASTAPLMLLAVYNDQVSDERTQQEVERTLAQTGSVLVDRMQELFQSDIDVDRGISNDFCASLAAEQGVEFSIYRDHHISASSRPEVFESGILDRRLDANVFVPMILQGDEMVIERQSIGPVSYAVGYFTWRVGGRRAGILAVPTLFRQREIEADLAERNAYVLVAYGFALVLVLLLGWYFSDRVTRPIRALTAAAGALGRGESVPALRSGRNDEIGTLVRTFNEMVRELEENRKMLAKVEREQAWREMAKQVAHEIKNPLTPMKLSVQQLLQSFKDKARNREETLWDVSTTLLEQIDALSRIASEFSHFARLPQGRFDKVDVNRSIREASGLFSSVPGIGFTLALPDGHAYVIADADEVRRVFVNLFRNSIQAMEGEGTIAITASIHASRLTVRVEDTGPGVPEDLSEKIFEPNFSTKTDGMGLGLAISRKILEDLGGSIAVSRLQRGACFTLVFPLQ